MNKYWLNDFNKYLNFNKNISLYTAHHVNSFNNFIEYDIPNIIKHNKLTFNVFDMYKNEITVDVEIRLNNDYFKKPVKNNEPIYPNNARLNNDSYTGQLVCDFILNLHKDRVTNKQIILENRILAELPILLLSNYCNLFQKSENELYKLNECIYEPGGYFLINGVEKVIVSQERLVSNKIHISKKENLATRQLEYLCEVKSKPLTSDAEKTLYIKGVFTKHMNKKNDTDENDENEENNTDIKYYEKEQYTKIKTDSNIQFYILFPGVGSTLNKNEYNKHGIPLFILFRALGVNSDKEILDIILHDVDFEEYELYKTYLYSTIFEDNTQYITTKYMALEYIKTKILGKGANVTLNEVYNLICDNILPHIISTNSDENVIYNKLIYIGYMTKKLIDVVLDKAPLPNRDAYTMKRIESTGYLLSSLFREWYISLKTNMEIKLKTKLANLNLLEDDINIFNENDYNNIISKAGNENIITDGFNKAFRGKWGVKSFGRVVTTENIHEKVHKDRYTFQKERLVQGLKRLNYYATLYHLREIKTPIDPNLKLVGPRNLHSTQYGFICPVDTPDGAQCGITKNMAISCTITHNLYNQKFIDIKTLIYKKDGFIKLENYNITLKLDHYKIFENGLLLGIYINNDITDFHNILKLYKRNAIIDYTLSIYINYIEKEMHILDEKGRCIRPLYAIYKGEVIRDRFEKELDIEQLIKKNSNISFSSDQIYTEDFIKELEQKQSPIELIDTEEQYYTMIAMDKAVLVNKHIDYQYLELNPQLMFGVTANILAFFNHSPPVRAVYAIGQIKQALGMMSTNFLKRFDTASYNLQYAQVPIVRTNLIETIKYNKMCSGINLIFAILTYKGYNQEDSIILNRGSIDRGLYNSSYYNTYLETLKSGEYFMKPDINYRSSSNKNYYKINEKGIIGLNEYITDDDIIIGKVVKNTDLSSTQVYIDKSISIHKNQEGITDLINIGENHYNQPYCKVRVRLNRNPIIGDKFTSRHAQKGTVGNIFKHEDMPFTKDGIVPDIIFNPHGFPSRMTLGQLFEVIGGKVGLLLGCFYDASPFQNIDIDVLCNLLESLGYQKHAHEILYNSETGEQMIADIVMGPIYYHQLKHMVNDKFHSRTTGKNQTITHQPTQGRANNGGLRLGEMERDSLLAHGLMYFVTESFMDRSDGKASLSENFYIYVSKQSGLIVPYNQKFKYNPEDVPYISKIHIPYAMKQFIYECQAQNVVLRLFTDRHL